MPYQRLWLYNGAPLIAFYDRLGIRRTYSRLKPPASSRGENTCKATLMYKARKTAMKLLCPKDFLMRPQTYQKQMNHTVQISHKDWH